MIEKRIDFLIVITAEKCNPNGDPLLGNAPRQDYDGYGEISDVCLKRKIRNRMQDMGRSILNQMNERSDDGYYSIKDRINACEEFRNAMNKKYKNIHEKINDLREISCRTWTDVRCFGQVFPLKGGNGVGVSFPVRGPVSISFAKSIDIISVEQIQITKSLNLEVSENQTKDSATMGMKYIIDKGAYVAQGSIFPQLASLTGFSHDDAEIIHECLRTLFENDASAARTSGSMSVHRLYWWGYKDIKKIPSPIATFRALSFEPLEEYPFYTVKESFLPGFEPEIYRGDIYE